MCWGAWARAAHRAIASKPQRPENSLPRERGTDILVHPEQVSRIELRLDYSQALERARVVRVPDARLALGCDEVDVDLSCAVRLHRVEELLRPCEVAGGLLRIFP